jgi:hypothetical protein
MRNAPSRTTAKRKLPRLGTAIQPRPGTWLVAYTSAASPAVTVIAPAASTLACRCPGAAGTTRGLTRSTRAPTGTLTNSTQRQLT